MLVDIIVFAVMAVLIISKLYKTLGQIDPSDRSSNNKREGQYFVVEEANLERKLQYDKETAEEEKIRATLDDEVRLGLDKLDNMLKDTEDARFMSHKFVHKASIALEMVLNAAYNGQISVVRKLTTSSALEQIKSICSVPNASKVDYAFIGFDKNYIKGINFAGDLCYIELLFEVESMYAVFDANGSLIDGMQNKVVKNIYLCTFEKSLKSASNIWLISDITKE